MAADPVAQEADRPGRLLHQQQVRLLLGDQGGHVVHRRGDPRFEPLHRTVQAIASPSVRRVVEEDLSRHPLFKPLGVAIQESTRGENNLDAMPITFVYTVLLMIIMGVTMYLVYGRGSRAGAPRKAKKARA